MTGWSIALHGDSTGAVLARLETAGSQAAVVRTCFELGELLATVASGIADAVVLVEPGEDLTRSLLSQLRRHEVTVLVLAENPEEYRALGPVTAPPDASAEVLLQGLEAAAAVEQDWEDAAILVHRPGVDPEVSAGAEAGSLPAPEGVPTVETLAGERPRGQCWTVWGPLGAPGTTTLAVNLAAECAQAGASVCLVDADTFAASCAAVLGLLDESSGLSRACRAAERGQLDRQGLESCCDRVQVAGSILHVLTGITRPDRWIEIRQTGLAAVIDQARQDFDVVVVDTAFGLETDGGSWDELGAPERHEATRQALASATEIIAVGRADALGVPRLIRGLDGLRDLGASAPVRVVLNHCVPNGAGGGDDEEVRAAWARFGTGEIFAMLPEDAGACGQALRHGDLLLESSRDSALRRALQDLAHRLAPERVQASAQRPGILSRWARGRRSRSGSSSQGS